VIDPSRAEASWFLIVAGTAFLFAFALPILFAPLAWAKAFKWNVIGEDPLLLYFARCLGGVAVAICAIAIRAAPMPKENAVLFDLFVAVGAILTGVHVYGAVKKQQPWTETAEIALYAGVVAIAAWIRSTL
jgi:hypothetical protein